MSATRKRRSPGEGGVYPYMTGAGERHRFKCVVIRQDGTRESVNRRGFLTKKAALTAMREAQAASDKGQFTEPSKQRFGAYGAEHIDGLRVRPQTRASYVKNWRNHIEPYPIADMPLAQLTGVRLTSHYRLLEKSGRKDHKAGEGLSPRTVRYIHTIVHGILRQAVKDNLLPRNPADAATAPTAKEAKAPEMHPWSAAQLQAFLRWASVNSRNYPLWHVLATTGMRRSEALAQRRRDIALDEATVTVRRSAGMVRVFGEGAAVIEGDTKSGKPRVVDLDTEDADGIPSTVKVLRNHLRSRAGMALQLARPDALVFGDIEGGHRNPEHVSRQFTRDVARCRNALGGDTLPMIRLHDLRHTHATILLLAGEPLHVVSARLGHASPVITLSVYAHVMPGNGRQAAGTFARIVRGADA